MAKEVEITWISEAEACSMMQLSKYYFRQSVREGRIQGINFSKINGKTYLYSKQDINAYILSHSTLTKEKSRTLNAALS